MSEINRNSHELLRRYLSGAITAPEEAELERLARTDETLREAMQGLQSAPEEDHQARIERMKMRARTQVQGEVEGKAIPASGAVVRPITRYRYYAAAAVLLLLVSAVFLLPRLQQEALAPTTTAAMKEEVPVEALSEAAAPEPIAEQELAAEGDDQTSPAPEVQPQNPRPRPTTAPARPPVTAAPPPPPAKPAKSTSSDATEVEADVAEEELADIAPPLLRSPTPAPVQRADEGIIPEREVAEAAAKERAQQESQRQRDVTDDLSSDLAAPTAGFNVPAKTLIGRVTTENGEPIFNALVRQPGLPIGQRTDSNGVFQLPLDATMTLLDISHPDFNEERVEVSPTRSDLQITLEQDEKMDYEEWRKSWQATKIPLSKMPGYALPEEGYNALRKRIEDNKPSGLPSGKIKLSFLVDPDGTLSDFVFRGQPDQATMDYIGETIMNTTIWNVVKGEEPVRVYFKVVFE